MDSFGIWLRRKGPRIEPGTDRENWTKSDKRYFRTKIEPLVVDLCQKWQVSDLFPPELDFEEALEARDSGDYRIIPRSWRRPYETEDSRKSHISIGFDLDLPLTDLVEHAKSILSSAHRNYRKQMKEHGVSLPKARRRFDDYDVNLEIWDLKQEGKSNSEIARLLFAGYRPDVALNRVRDHLKAANRLISGHYREIR